MQETAPYMGGSVPVRFLSLPKEHWLHGKLKDANLPNLYAFREPLSGTALTLVECYHSDEIRGEYYRKPVTVTISPYNSESYTVTHSGGLDPFQYDDYRRGGLVCMGWDRVIILNEVDADMELQNLRRGAWRISQFSAASANSRKQELKNVYEAEQEAELAKYDDLIDQVADDAAWFNPYHVRSTKRT
jgi:hypothetical protein